MILVLQMTKFMDDHIVDTLARRADKLAAYYQVAACGKAAPPVREIADDQSGFGVAQ